MHKEERRESISGWEFVFAVVGALLVCSAAGFLLYEALVGESSPPSVRVQVEGIVRLDQGYLVRFRAHNTGATTAAGVQVEGVLSQEGRPVETAETTLDYLPAKSHRSAGLFFENDPRRFRLNIQPKGFEEP
jgi:uncharacterized protein (TIGR02588 family)